MPHGPSTIDGAAGSVTFQHALIVTGQIAGTWRLSREGDRTRPVVTPLRPLGRSEQRAIADAVRRYDAFASER